MNEHIILGNSRTIIGKFTHEGVPTDPIVVRATYSVGKDPQITFTYGVGEEITRISQGIFSFKILANKIGEVHYRMDDGSVDVATEGMFTVKNGFFKDVL